MLLDDRPLSSCRDRANASSSADELDARVTASAEELCDDDAVAGDDPPEFSSWETLATLFKIECRKMKTYRLQSHS